MSEDSAISSTLSETRRFPPAKSFAAAANIKSLDEYRTMYEKSIREPEAFWAEIAEQHHWFEKWHTVRDWQRPDVKWFVGGKTNPAYNCLDLQIERCPGDNPTILWEGHNRRRAPTLPGVRDNHRVPALHDRHKRVGGTEIDPDHLL